MDKFYAIQGVPWEPIPGRQGIEIKARVNLSADQDPVGVPMRGEYGEVIHRRVIITREQVRIHGFTVGCPGCRAINRGMPAVNHTEECWKRFEDTMR